MRNILRNILKNRLALSTVITTLIILVVAVLLAGVVTYFAINIVSTRVQQESLQISYAHIWVDSSGNAIGALMITNTGGRDVVINQIQVRGQPVNWDNTTAAVYAGTPKSTDTDLSYIAASALGSTYTATSGPLTLSAGSSVVVYTISPDSVSLNDIGSTIAFTVFTAQAIFYQEANVQAAPAS
ncbi:MAG: type IV pilin [Candidatus Bathyarchaeia archaeon]|jgi:FlaG/FlaF family flagellin (archaellin)